MATTNTTSVTLALNTLQKYSFPLFTGTSDTFDMPLSYSYDLTITGTTATGTLDLFFLNEDYTVTTFIPGYFRRYSITSGVFTGGELKKVFDNNGYIFTKYMGMLWTPSTPSATDTILVKGQLTYKG